MKEINVLLLLCIIWHLYEWEIVNFFWCENHFWIWSTTIFIPHHSNVLTCSFGMIISILWYYYGNWQYERFSFLFFSSLLVFSILYIHHHHCSMLGHFSLFTTFHLFSFSFNSFQSNHHHHQPKKRRTQDKKKPEIVMFQNVWFVWIFFSSSWMNRIYLVPLFSSFFLLLFFVTH
mgnify:CR=1 FL=1